MGLVVTGTQLTIGPIPPCEMPCRLIKRDLGSAQVLTGYSTGLHARPRMGHRQMTEIFTGYAAIETTPSTAVINAEEEQVSGQELTALLAQLHFLPHCLRDSECKNQCKSAALNMLRTIILLPELSAGRGSSTRQCISSGRL